MLLGGGENEDRMGGRLLQSLEKGAESRGREHVDLVDDENRITPHLRNDAHLLDEGADVLDGVVRRGVELVDVERTALVERTARLALVARLGAAGGKAVDGLGEDAGAGGLAHAARPAKKVGMGQLSALDGVFQRRSNMLLPHDRRKGRRAVFSCTDDEFAHSRAKIRKAERNAKFI